MSGFDIHFIISTLAEKFLTCKLGAIILNLESYVGVTINTPIGDDRIQLRFLNSMKFLGSSVKALMFNLNGCKFNYIDDSYIAHPSH